MQTRLKLSKVKNSMTYILNIETSTKNCSVSIAQNGNTIALREIASEGYSHAEKLHVFIEETLEEAKISYKELAAVAIGSGPGSYTGLRIGVSAAKGLCYALGIPLISIESLRILAQKVTVADGLIIPMLDARRMEVYCCIFDHELNIIEKTSAKILDENSFEDINGTITIVGDCQEKCLSMLKADRFKFLAKFQYPSAAEMGLLSFAKYETQQFEDVSYFEPFYLKDFLVTVAKPKV